MLIARQRPDATKVAGFRTWNSLGRFVNKGERGILILAPMVRRKPEERESLPEETVASERELFGFRAAYVFDISQTGGNDLPHLTEVQGDVVGLRERLTAWLAGQAITVVHSADIAPARGVSSGGKITLLPGLPAAEEFATLVHEVAHELLHRGDRRLETTKQIRETEAEAVAFAVCESLGLETGSASADYIQLWHGDAKLLTASLGIIQRTSAVILAALSPTEKREVDGAGHLQASAPSPLCANVLGGQGPPGEMMKRRRLLIPSPLDWQMPPACASPSPSSACGTGWYSASGATPGGSGRHAFEGWFADVQRRALELGD